MANDSNNSIKRILRDFAEKIAERPFLDSKYVVYLYTLMRNDNNFEMKLEAVKAAKKFNKTNNYPLPKEIGKSWRIPFEKHLSFAYGRGGDIISCETVYNYDASLKNETENPKYWEDKFAYYYRYRCQGRRMVILLIFDIDSNEPEGHNIMAIDLFPILKGVEDIHHKKIIFYEEHLNLLRDKIGKKIFPDVYKSMGRLFQGYRYSQYLLKIYYDFLHSNMQMLAGIGIEPEQQEKFLMLTEEFEESQKNLFKISRYRDHFLHQCNVYLLGVAVLNIIKSNNFISDLYKYFNAAYRPKGKAGKYKNNQEIAFTWFVASMFHDIAYPVEKSHQLVEVFFKRYIFPHKTKKSVFKQDLNIFKTFFDPDYSQSIEELADIHRQLNFSSDKINYQTLKDNITLKRDYPIRGKIMTQIFDSQDHGILSAIMLLNRFDTDTNMFKYLFPAVAAISIHNFQWIDEYEFKMPCKSCSTVDTGCTSCENWKNAYDKYFVPELRFTEFEKDPLGFLLIFCDTLQDWGRYDFEDMEHAHDEFYNQSRIKNIRVEDKNIIFDLSITTAPDSEEKGNKMDFLLYKKQEIAKVFSRLKFIDGNNIIVNLKPEDGDEASFSMNSFD